MLRNQHLLAAVAFAAAMCVARPAPIVPDALSQDLARFRRRMESPIAEYRLEGLQGVAHLRLQEFEPELLRLLRDDDALVVREAAQALSLCGTHRCVPALIGLLGHRDWAIRRQAHLSLQRITAQTSLAASRAAWDAWWKGTTLAQKQAALFAQVAGDDAAARLAAARALRSMATPDNEAALLDRLQKNPQLGPKTRQYLMEALDRVGSDKAMPYLLARARAGDNAAAWALGRRRGPDAEAALIQGFRRRRSLDFMLSLDRIRTTKLAPFVPYLARQFGSLINSGSRTEDFRYRPKPLHRVLANLIRRTGQGPMLVDLVLSELEGKDIEARIPKAFKPHFDDLRCIVVPGFLREGFGGAAYLLTMMCYVADDPALSSRLVPLLRHECITVRIYAALTLGHLRCADAVAPMVAVVQAGYPFSDSTAAASGKHTVSFRVIDGKRQRQSQTVRWLGYVCMALGRIGTDEARLALEELATNPDSPRDVRQGSVVGLGFIQSPQSLPALKQVEQQDVIWMIRREAGRAVREIELVRSAARGQ